MKEILFISDLHLSQDYPDSLSRFKDFASNLSNEVEQIFMLGDVFDFWIGDDGAKALGHHEIERLLHNISSSGIELFFLPGNRDFLVGMNFAHRTGCKLLPDPSVLEIGGERVYLTHGDALCTDDIEHQTNRHTMLSSKWRVAFLNKSIDERLETAIALRKKSESSKRNKPSYIMDINQSYLENVMREKQVRTVIHGHTHRPAIHTFNLDGIEARRYVLGDWYTQNSVLTFRKGEFILE
ncbi:MAG: UDP-2,3-diacylglucosamine diphosphatase [Gammaproteobacteria bacterium]|nr:UDP-2,3-diacylglucosamine diphosphatase [Gammaproteobacteria bacterium]MCY4274603.1 UDP-2,3-diacylglucosamine diphosphatase [Gammaproteobacteria bacterium]